MKHLCLISRLYFALKNGYMFVSSLPDCSTLRCSIHNRVMESINTDLIYV